MRLNKVLIVPDSYKNCLSSYEVCKAMEQGVLSARTDIETVLIPASDGGEGFCDCIHSVFGGEYVTAEVTYPDGKRGKASYVYVAEDDHAYIETAAASGLCLVNEIGRNAVTATSLGTGELIRHAILKGAKKITVGLGGSATTDGGMGILHALGARFYDSEDNALYPCGASMLVTSRCDKSEMIDVSGIKITAACDVKNPLYGKNGAAYVYAPQKGATPYEVVILDAGLAHFAAVAGIDGSSEGSGAAGGCGGALLSLLGAEFISGAELLTGSDKFTKALSECDLVLTGEGKTDAQTLYGKLVSVVNEKAKAYGKPVAVVSGVVDNEKELKAAGITECYSCSRCESSLEAAIKNAKGNIEKTVYGLIKDLEE